MPERKIFVGHSLVEHQFRSNEFGPFDLFTNRHRYRLYDKLQIRFPYNEILLD